MGLTWTQEKMDAAQKIVTERFAQNSVAGHLAAHTLVDDVETTIKRNRFDFGGSMVVDREVAGLFEPYSFCRLTQAQVDEFGKPGATQTESKAVTALTRAASRLARWHDVLFFFGPDGPRPGEVQMPALENPAPSLREAARQAEADEGVQPVPVPAPFNERLVGAVYESVLRLETQGYFTEYHLILGQNLWRDLHEPTAGSMVLPRDRVEPTLMGGKIYRTTALPEDEGLLVSKDGPTFDVVLAGDPAQQPRFEFLRVESSCGEEVHLFRARIRFAPRVRENRAIVRLQRQAGIRQAGGRRTRSQEDGGKDAEN